MRRYLSCNLILIKYDWMHGNAIDWLHVRECYPEIVILYQAIHRCKNG
jgi:hypothetical protein